MQKIKMSYKTMNRKRGINSSGLHSLKIALVSCLRVIRFSSRMQLYKTQQTGFCQNLPSVLTMDIQ